MTKWLRGYPADEFAPPGGGLLIGLSAACPSPAARSAGSTTPPPSSSASGPTAGIGARATPRRCSPSSRREIAARGYRRVCLTTGDRQPEAEALYLSTGYVRLAEPLPAEGEVYPLAFQKTLSMTQHLHLAVALDGYGWHPEAWRHTPDAEPG